LSAIGLSSACGWWDDAKNRNNGSRAVFASWWLFSQVSTISDLRAEHSEFEDRFIAIGPINRALVVVVYTEPEEGLIRIIGARWATKREQALYRSHMERLR
jgi:uncharacterized DUF497 family protein